MGRPNTGEALWRASRSEIFYMYSIHLLLLTINLFSEFVSIFLHLLILIIGKSKHPTAGSFVRPSRAADKPRSFLEALREKYASEFEEEAARRKLGDAASGDSLHKPIAISGKIVEEVGFDKIRKQLAELQELKIVLLDGLRVAGVLAHEGSAEQFQSACKEIEQTCPKIVELDLSRNLLNRWRDVASICDSLKRLKTLKLK